MGETIHTDEYVAWFSHLVPSDTYVRVGTAAAGVSITLFLVGYVVGVVGNFDYLSEPEGYLGAFGVFWLLTWLGIADTHYVDVWNEIRPAFAVDDETYRAAVQYRLQRIYDNRRILSHTATLALPYVLIVTAIYLPGSPFRDVAANVFLAESDPYAPNVLRVIEFYLIGIVNALLLATVINGFLNHLALIREVAELPFQNIYTTASDLEPVGRFTIASSTVWFAGISLIILWMGIGVSSAIATAIIAVLVFTGIVFFLAPQLRLHDALIDAKQDALAEVRAEYDEMYQTVKQGAQQPESLSPRLELTDRRLANVQSIRTWVYDVSSIGKLVAASMIPWLKLVQQSIAMSQLLNVKP